MTEAEVRSAFTPEEWHLVGDAVYGGVVHACNNRVAALGGLVEMHEHRLAEAVDVISTLREEVLRFRALMELLRALMFRRGERREPVRLVDALRGAAALLAHHPVARQWKITVADEPPDVEPVLLWPTDPLRFGVMLLLLAGCESHAGELRAAVLRKGKQTEASVVSAASVDAITDHPAFTALARAAERERGTLEVKPYAGTSSSVVLRLPGLTTAKARSAR